MYQHFLGPENPLFATLFEPTDFVVLRAKDNEKLFSGNVRFTLVWDASQDKECQTPVLD